MNSYLFAEKANRDARYKELKAAGILGLKRSSIRNQQIHPMHLEDRKSQLSQQDCAFGNTIYKTSFSCLYEVSWTVKS